MKTSITTETMNEINSNMGGLYDDTLRVASSAAITTMLTARLGMRATNITMDTMRVGLNYALEHTPKDYEETKQAWGNMVDDLKGLLDEPAAQ